MDEQTILQAFFSKISYIKQDAVEDMNQSLVSRLEIYYYLSFSISNQEKQPCLSQLNWILSSEEIK